MRKNRLSLFQENFKRGISASLTLIGIFCFSISLYAQPKTNPDKQREVNNFGADLDITIHRQYKFLEDFGKELIDVDIQSVPYQVHISQPKRKWSVAGKIYTNPNTVEIIQHGFIYDVEAFGNEPMGRRYKTLLLKFTGTGDNRKLKEIEMELYEKNYQTRTFFWVSVKDTNPITNISKQFIASYKPDSNGFTSTDKDIYIARRSNSDDSEQIALEMAAAMSGNKAVAPKVEKKLMKIKNTPAQPLRNTFKNAFYRKHLADFSNIVFSIYEMHRRRAKDSDSYMLDFLKESTQY